MRSQYLDFDDAYQYVIVKRERLELISFDADFGRSDLAFKLPDQVVASLPPRS
jgi:predicted nucleic acid-binding protein